MTDTEEIKECLLETDNNETRKDNSDDLPTGLSIDTRPENNLDMCQNQSCRIQLMTPNGDCCQGAVPYYPACFAIPTGKGTSGSPHLLIAAPATSAQAISPSTHSDQAYSTDATPASDQKLVEELKRLRERLKAIESENAHMSCILREQQSDVNHRLEDLEHQIGSSRQESDSESESGLLSRCKIDLSNFTGPSINNMESMI